MAARWHNIFTTGVVMLGVHMVTVPLAWPQHSTAFQGFWAMSWHLPSRVRCWAAMWPVLVSW
jgi:hypothetical protein